MPYSSLLGLPLLAHSIGALVNVGVREITLLVDSTNSEPISKVHGAFSKDILLTERQVNEFSGTAGDLKQLETDLSPLRFFVVPGELFVREPELNALSRQHRLKRPVATAAVGKCGQFMGLYLFESVVFQLIHKGYMDIEEDLIPMLRHRGLPISYRSFGNESLTPRLMRGYEDFLNTERCLLHCRAGADGQPRNWVDRRRLRQVAADVWLGRDVKISPRARLAGPVIIGDRTEVEEDTQIIGPSFIGKDCRILRRAFVRESSVWDGSQVGSGCRVEGSLLSFGASIPSSRVVVRELVLRSPLTLGTLSIFRTSQAGAESLQPGLALVPSTADRVRWWSYTSLKRLVDIVGAVAGLALALPFIPLIAVAIKLDSPGPVLFHQRRCGRSGKEFVMLKFRTMVLGAEHQQMMLRSQNQVEGPVFKLFNDPRVTRVGRFLRSASLDELPQFLNVLRGEMSLIGPRPLAREELQGCPMWRAIRLVVRPGITGRWQVNARHSPDFSEWIRNDVGYIVDQSIGQDVKVFIRTLILMCRTCFGLRK